VKEMQNEKSLTQFSQQHQSVVQEVDQILQENKSTIPPPEHLLSIDNNFPSAINASNTGIKEFDKLLDGGFTKGSIILLAGSSGSGKTIFSFQWLFEGIKNNENGIYITLTEPLFKTLENLEKLSYYNKEAIENEKLRIVDLREVCGKEGFDQRKILDFIEDEVKRTNAKRLCIDSITAIAYQLDDRAKIRAFIFALGTALATLGCTTVLTSEVSEMNKYSKYEVEEFISDAIIRFDQINVKDELQRIMRIIKVRGRNHRSDDIYFKITKDGINVFPKLRVPLEHFSTTERISMGISALDEMLGGGIFVGSSTFITGSPGTGKSTLGLSFLADGLKNGEICLYVGFEESKKQVLRNAKNFGWDFEKYEREGLLVMRCIYPNEKYLEEHLADIRQIVEEKKIKRCVVDPLSAISSAFSPDVFISFSKRLNGYLKTREVTPLFTSATTSLIGNTKDVDSHISTISDNIILLRYVEMQGDVQSVINIIKMRGSEHSKSLRIYNITDKGVVVGKSLEGYEGVTTGVSKKIAELEEESKELKEIIKQKEMTEKYLHESEERHRILFESSQDAIMTLGPPSWNFTTANPATIKMFKAKNEAEFISYGPGDLSPERQPDGRNSVEKAKEMIEKAMREGSAFFEWTHKRIDGEEFPATVLLSRVELAGKTFIQATVRDITAQTRVEDDRKKAQEELKESEEKFRDLFENANDLIQSADVNGRFIYVNKKWLMTLGYTEDEVKSLTITDILRKDQIPHCMEIINEVRNGKSFEKVETVFMSKNGREIYVEGGANAKFKDGKFIATRGFFRDITERKQAEKVLRDSEERFRAIFDCTNDGIIIADTENKKFVIGNKAISNMLGYNIDEIKNLGVMEIHPQKDLSFVIEQFEKLARKEIALAENIPMKRKDGSIFYADINSVPVTLAGKTFLLGSFRDITIRKQAQEELKVVNEKLNQIKSDFFEVTTREIRSPLTTIKGYMEMLSNRAFGEITDEQKKYLEIVLRNTNRLDNIVSDLVDISRIESGSMAFTSEKTIVSKMVNEAVEKMQSSANEKNIAIHVEIEDQTPDLIIDQDRIKQVIINIIEYAIKFSPDETTVNLRAKKHETDVLFEIQGQGISIAKDKQKKIFNAFYRADEGKSKEFSGGGIRLALSRGIVTIHGGKIWVESEDGKGSTFRFTLPIKPVDNIQTRCKESDIFEPTKDDENIEIN
jgi:circadian clock protein KaiC